MDGEPENIAEWPFLPDKPASCQRIPTIMVACRQRAAV